MNRYDTCWTKSKNGNVKTEWEWEDKYLTLAQWINIPDDTGIIRGWKYRNVHAIGRNSFKIWFSKINIVQKSTARNYSCCIKMSLGGSPSKQREQQGLLLQVFKEQVEAAQEFQPTVINSHRLPFIVSVMIMIMMIDERWFDPLSSFFQSEGQLHWWDGDGFLQGGACLATGERVQGDCNLHDADGDDNDCQFDDHNDDNNIVLCQCFPSKIVKENTDTFVDRCFFSARFSTRLNARGSSTPLGSQETSSPNSQTWNWSFSWSSSSWLWSLLSRWSSGGGPLPLGHRGGDKPERPRLDGGHWDAGSYVPSHPLPVWSSGGGDGDPTSF